jgi:hypothetical protein
MFSLRTRKVWRWNRMIDEEEDSEDEEWDEEEDFEEEEW